MVKQCPIVGEIPFQRPALKLVWCLLDNNQASAIVKKLLKSNIVSKIICKIKFFKFFVENNIFGKIV